MPRQPKLRATHPEMPNFIRDDLGKSLENVAYEDLGWHVDPTEEAALAGQKMKDYNEALFEIRPLIDSILLAIILADGPLGDASARLNSARRSLGLNTGKTRRRGRPEEIDDASLRKVASRYHKATFDDVARNVPLDPIIRQVVAEEKPHGEKSYPRDRLKFERLRDKFKIKKNYYLSSVGTELLLERKPRLDAARRILHDLETLGIKVNRKLLDPALQDPWSDNRV